MGADDYEIEAEMIVSGPSTFYRARNKVLGHEVLLRRLTVDPARAEDARDTFYREQRLSARLAHPHIQRPLDVFEDGGFIWSVHDYLPLENVLRAREGSGPCPVAEVARLGSHVAGALSHMHGRGLVHGKVRPDTVLVDANGDALLINLVKAADLAAGIWPLRPAVLGLSPFTAPEEFRGERPTPPTDLYGLAATIVYWLTERWPRGGATAEEALERARSGAEVIDLCALRPDLPPSLAHQLYDALAADPAERHASVASLETVLVEAHRRFAAEVPSGFRTGVFLKPAGCADSFEILGRHGAGAYGVVLRARRARDGALVAVKALKPEHRDNQEALERFLREARALQQIHHENVVRIHGVGEERGTPYALMEFVEGPDLATLLLAEGCLPPARAAALGAAIARGVAAIHDGGIIHRDLKPHNILIGDGDRPVIADFGVARDTTLTRMTVTGGLVGTPLYMAPEQFGDGPPTTASDLYALGTMLYEMLAGRLPFASLDPVATLEAIRASPVPPLPAEVPEALASLVLRLLEKDPARRPTSASDVAAELDRVAGSLTGTVTPAV